MKTLSEKVFVLAAVLLCAIACNRGEDTVESGRPLALMTRRDVARMLSLLPLGSDQLREVYDAVSSSTANGYDEEYMMSDLLTAPGAGVGDVRGKSRKQLYSTPIRSLIEDYLASREASSTKAGAADVQRYLDELIDSGMQIYWPYSELWDGSTLPLITYDPGNGAESNYAYVITSTDGGYEVVDSVFVDENVAKSRPVWVINQNDDSACVPLSAFLGTKSIWDSDDEDEEEADRYNLYIKDFTMMRHYDPWFAGASEFHVWCGGVDGFYASTEEQLKNYTPSITDFIVVVKRSEIGKKKRFNAVLVTDFSDQLDKLAFLIVEDDGGTRTNWKCAASVKIKSKTYGFDIDIPYRSSDDVVWRGQLGATYFTKGKAIEGRFGDVKLTFALV
jgi:hypothetical protein